MEWRLFKGFLTPASCRTLIAPWGFRRPRLLTPRPHEVFIVHPEPVRDAIDVIEVGDHLRRIVDGVVVEAVLPKDG